MSIFDGNEIVCCCRHQKCAGVHVCENVDPLLLKDQRELNPKSLEDVIKAQVESRVEETDTMAKRTLMYFFLSSTRFHDIYIYLTRFFSIVHLKPCCGEKPDGTQCDGHPILRASKNVCDFYWPLLIIHL